MSVRIYVVELVDGKRAIMLDPEGGDLAAATDTAHAIFRPQRVARVAESAPPKKPLQP